MHLLLCGLPCTGKTTLGKKVAQLLGKPFIDTDTLIEESYFHSTGIRLCRREIFLQKGKEFFRALEKTQMEHLISISESNVIALGGGSLDDLGTQSFICRLGYLLHLQLPFDLIWKRLCMRGIPPFLSKDNPKEHFRNLSRKRLTIYTTLAHGVVIPLLDPQANAFIISAHATILQPFKKSL